MDYLGIWTLTETLFLTEFLPVDVSKGLRRKPDVLQIHEVTTNKFSAMTALSEKKLR